MRIHRAWILTLFWVVGCTFPAATLPAQTGPAPQFGPPTSPGYGNVPPGQPWGQAGYGPAPGGSPYGYPPDQYSPMGSPGMMMPPGGGYPGPGPGMMMPPGGGYPGPGPGMMMPPGGGYPGPGPGMMMPPGGGYPGPGPGMMGPPGGGYPGAQAGYTAPGMPPQMMMDAPGRFQGPGPMGAPMEAGPCNACGGAGCQNCGLVGHGPFSAGEFGDLGDDHFRLHGLLRFLLPYGDGGCCAQRWFDVMAEAVFLKRENAGRYQPFTSDGPRGFGDPLIVLSTDNLNFDDPETGFRVSTALQLHPGGSLEFGYMGTANWASSATVTSDLDELFSVFSDFGSDPFLGFQDTDRSSLQSIAYSSTFDTFELDYRKRWVAPNCRVQGSWLMGVRYMKLDEEFIYLTRNTLGPPEGPGAMDYFVGTSNSMTGFQVGGDTWVCIIPGLRFGAEAKAGIYGNHASQRTTIDALGLGTPLVEVAQTDDVAFLSEAELSITWRLSYNWTLRGGYHFLYVDGVALAPENFNATAPFVQGPNERVVSINDNGNVFYHGFTLGLEWQW